MKTYFPILLLIACTNYLNGQTGNSGKKSLKNCYEEYNEAFESRGALPVPDGEQNVVFSLRTDTGCYCGQGIAKVMNGKIEPFLLVKREDGTYEPAKRRLHPKMKKGEAESPNLYNIFNGMSHTFITTDYEMVNLFFVDYLKRKLVPFAKAPNPNDIAGVQVDLQGKQKEIVEKAYEGLQFDYAKASIKPTSFPHLNLLAEMMKENKDYKIKIHGYTDNIGGAENNLTLSKNRASAVKEYLIKQGLEESRISTDGYGMENPIADNATEEGRAKNRRVEFIVIH